MKFSVILKLGEKDKKVKRDMNLNWWRPWAYNKRMEATKLQNIDEILLKGGDLMLN